MCAEEHFLYTSCQPTSVHPLNKCTEHRRESHDADSQCSALHYRYKKKTQDYRSALRKCPSICRSSTFGLSRSCTCIGKYIDLLLARSLGLLHYLRNTPRGDGECCCCEHLRQCADGWPDLISWRPALSTKSSCPNSPRLSSASATLLVCEAREKYWPGSRSCSAR